MDDYGSRTRATWKERTLQSRIVRMEVKISERQETLHFLPQNWHPEEYRCLYQVHYAVLSDRVGRIEEYFIPLFSLTEA